MRNDGSQAQRKMATGNHWPESARGYLDGSWACEGGLLAVGLALLGVVDPIQMNTLTVLVRQDFDGVTVEDTSYPTDERGRSRFTEEKEQNHEGDLSFHEASLNPHIPSLSLLRHHQILILSVVV